MIITCYPITKGITFANFIEQLNDFVISNVTFVLYYNILHNMSSYRNIKSYQNIYINFAH